MAGPGPITKRPPIWRLPQRVSVGLVASNTTNTDFTPAFEDLRLAVKARRNPFGVADVHDPDGADVQAFVPYVDLQGGSDDDNAKLWTDKAVSAVPGSIEGEWAGRWYGGDIGASWDVGAVTLKTVGDRVYILFKDSEYTFLIDARRDGQDRLIGRYACVGDPSDSTPWVGRIVSPERIDGQWTAGRWDFRRKVTGDVFTDQQRLQGKWRLVSAEHQGKPVPVAELKDADWIIFSGETQTTNYKGKIWKGMFKLNDAADPKQLDFLSPEYDTVYAIYQVAGDKLTIAQGQPGESRPASYTTTGESIYAVYQYQREPPAASPPPAGAPFDESQAKAHQEAWARHLGTEVEITNTLGMKLRLIPPGEYVKGSTPAEIEAAEKLAPDFVKESVKSEGPARKVRIDQPFALGVHEVTVGQFRRFVDATGYVTDSEKDGKGGWMYSSEEKTMVQRPECIWRNSRFAESENHPVVFLTLNDAQRFCAWLSQVEGRQYVIPTETQWEFACRAGTESHWHWGNDTRQAEAYAWWSGNSRGMTHAVGRKRPNPFGLHDMVGNIDEMTLDDKDSPIPIARGGSFGTDLVLARSAWRFLYYPVYHATWGRGFRVALIGVAP